MTFLQHMVLNHQQTLDLVALIPGRTTNHELVTFAERNVIQQRSELQGFQAQLLQWELPEGTRPGGDPNADIPGKVDTATLDKLSGLHGAQFDALWVSAMIGLYQGAITMAQDQIDHGESPEAVSIARTLLPLEQSELEQLRRLSAAS